MEDRKKEMILPASFYQEEDVVGLSQKLLGKYLLTKIGNTITGGPITETEAYKGAEDRACHAYQNRRTKRTEVMFQNGGICYVYLCYGIHHLLNVVTNKEGTPHAILIRAIAPEIGIETMYHRRNMTTLSKLTNGPGSLSQALGVNLSFNGLSLGGKKIWIEEREEVKGKIVASKRIGIDYAGSDKDHLWRFQIT